MKIADFGIAKLLGETPAAGALTGAQDRVGTPHYMAPEQVEQSRTVDHRADIFSLRVVFYEMLTGELPLGRFDAPSQRVRIDVRLDEVVLLARRDVCLRRYFLRQSRCVTGNTDTREKRMRIQQLRSRENRAPGARAVSIIL